MKVGDLVGIGWSGIKKQPFPAIITKAHDREHYTIYIFETCKTTFVARRNLKKFEDYLNK